MFCLLSYVFYMNYIIETINYIDELKYDESFWQIFISLRIKINERNPKINE